MTRTRFLFASLAAFFLLTPAAAAPVRVAGADVGSTGVRAVVLEFDPDAPGGPVRVLTKTDVVTTTGEFKGGELLPARIAETAADLGRLVDVFVAEYRVSPDRIHLVGSSALVGAANRDALVRAVEEKTRVRMTFLRTPEEEARLTARGLTVLAGRAGGLLIDVGGGNAKGVVDAAAGSVEFGVPFGTRSLATRAREVAKARNVAFAEAVAAVRDAELVPAVRAAVGGKPALAGRAAATLTGGIAYAAATLVHPARAADATVALTPADFRRLIELLGRDGPAFPAVDVSGIADPAVRKRAEADLRDVREKFPPENLYAGATVVLALGAELKLEDRPLTFVRAAHFAWIVGYLTRPGSVTPASDEEKGPARPAAVGTPLPPEPLALGVPYYTTPSGGYVPLAPPRGFGYTAPYAWPTTGGRYSWDYAAGNLSNPWAYRYPAYPRPASPVPPTPYPVRPGLPR